MVPLLVSERGVHIKPLITVVDSAVGSCPAFIGVQPFPRLRPDSSRDVAFSPGYPGEARYISCCHSDVWDILGLYG